MTSPYKYGKLFRQFQPLFKLYEGLMKVALNTADTYTLAWPEGTAAEGRYFAVLQIQNNRVAIFIDGHDFYKGSRWYRPLSLCYGDDGWFGFQNASKIQILTELLRVAYGRHCPVEDVITASSHMRLLQKPEMSI